MADAKTSAKTTGLTLGLARFARISAVEGVKLSETAKREFRDEKRRQASADERRRRIIAKYAAKA